MRLTNRTGLPAAIVDAVRNDPYGRGDADISVTQLIAPPRKVALEAAHADELIEDASERIWSLLGQSIHTILERANRTGIAERRLSMAVEGWVISGGMDLYDEDGVLVDYKTTSAWSCKGGPKEEWTTQLNVYSEILRANGHPVKGLRVVAILRDWSKLEAARDPSYPQTQVVQFDIELWAPERAAKYVRERVLLHKMARLTWAVKDHTGFEVSRHSNRAAAEEAAAGENTAAAANGHAERYSAVEVGLPLCSAAERWAKPPTFALMKEGGKRAVKLYDNEADARAHASVDPKLLRVEVRPGESTRCRFYCGAAPFCEQYQNSQPQKQAKEEDVA